MSARPHRGARDRRARTRPPDTSTPIEPSRRAATAGRACDRRIANGHGRPALIRAGRVAWVGLLIGCAATATVRVGAQELRVPAKELLAPATQVVAPAKLPAPQVSLEDAVKLTLQYNANVARTRRDLAAAEGRLREARGAFDYRLRLSPGYAYLQQEINSSTRQRESDKRNQLSAVYQTFDAMNRAIGESLASLTPRIPLCPAVLEFGFTSTTGNFITDRRDPAELQLFGLDQNFQEDNPLRAINGIIHTSVGAFRIEDICRSTRDTGPPGDIVSIWRRLSDATGYGLDAVVDGLQAFETEFLRFSDQLSNTLATRSLLALERLGPMPEDEVRKQVRIETGLSKRLRNGFDVAFNLRLNSEERNFKDKPLDPAFGGFGIRPRFPAFVAGSVEVPIGKGRGRVSAGANERAAQLSLRAQRDQLRQVAAEETFRTVLAYVNLVAAQQRVRLLEDSSQRQQQLLGLTDELIKVDELPAVDRTRAQARATTVGQSLEDARMSLLGARASLLDTLGLQAEDLSQAPVASDDLADVALSDLPALATWLQLSKTERPDPRALRALRDAAGVLANAARADLKRRIDLSLEGGYSTLYESPHARYLPDEANPIFSTDGVPPPEGRSVSYYNGLGWGRSINGEWRPYVKAVLTFELPFGNRTAKGRAEQAAASYERSATESTNLERVIQEQVASASEIARMAGEMIQRRRAAIGFQQQTLDGTLEQFKIGEVTLIDTLTTEQGLTDERLQLVSDTLVYLSALSRLKFETGTLLRFANPESLTETIEFRPLTRLVY